MYIYLLNIIYLKCEMGSLCNIAGICPIQTNTFTKLETTLYEYVNLLPFLDFDVSSGSFEENEPL